MEFVMQLDHAMSEIKNETNMIDEKIHKLNSTNKVTIQVK